MATDYNPQQPMLDITGEREFTENYFARIEQVWQAMSGRHQMLSPFERQTVMGWYEQGITVDCICQTMRNTWLWLMKKNRDDDVTTINYFKQPVLIAWKEFKRAKALEQPRQIAPAQTAETTIISGIRRIENALQQLSEKAKNKEYYADILESLSTLEKLKKCRNESKVETSLAQLERELLFAILEKGDRHAIQKLYIAVEEKIIKSKIHMDAEAYASTLETAVQDNLRIYLGLPKFTLYQVK